MDIHKDVISTIYKVQLDTLLAKKPSDLTHDEVIECYSSGLLAMHKIYEDLSFDYRDACKKYTDLAKLFLNLQKDQLRERRIFNLFLQNHGIDDYDYDNFESRILRKLFEIQDSKEGQAHGRT